MKTENDAAAANEPAILHEDEDVVVIDKPYGWLVHEDRSTAAPTVVDWFVAQYPDAAEVGEPGFGKDGEQLNRAGVVHRLDRETSGVMILAKNQVSHQYLKQQFKDRLVEKEYRAFVYGRMNDRWGTINRSIGRNAKDHRKRSAERGAKGKLREAITDFERIGMGEYKDEPFSYVKLKPKTGRTHQLRVHLRALDRPIVGDTLYADYKIEKSCHLDTDRLMLHAHILELVLPNGSKERFISPVPEVFDRAAEKIAE